MGSLNFIDVMYMFIIVIDMSMHIIIMGMV